MFCRNCGFELQDDARFCSKCGTAVDFVTNKTSEPEQTYGNLNENYSDYSYVQAEDNSAEKSALGGSVLKFGILGLVFSLTVFFSLLGLIFSSVALSKANAFKSAFGQTEGKATVGRSLGKAGLIVSIIMIAYLALCAIIGIAASL